MSAYPLTTSKGYGIRIRISIPAVNIDIANCNFNKLGFFSTRFIFVCCLILTMNLMSSNNIIWLVFVESLCYP